MTVERLIGPDSPLVMPFRHLDEYRNGADRIRRLYKLHQREGTDHNMLHSARVLFLALSIIQARKIKLNPMERKQLLTAIVFHDIDRTNDSVDDSHGKVGRQIYERSMSNSLDPVSDFKGRGRPGPGAV